MGEKDIIRFDCKAHSGIRAELDELKISDRDQWDSLRGLQTSKASSSQMRWVIGLFLIIALATVGFLWRAQVSSTETIVKKIEMMEKENGTKRDETNTKIDALKDRVNQLFWTVGEPKKHDGR
jgi:hypothetical protein